MWLSFKLTSRVGFEDSAYKTTAGPRLTSLLEQTAEDDASPLLGWPRAQTRASSPGRRRRRARCSGRRANLRGVRSPSAQVLLPAVRVRDLLAGLLRGPQARDGLRRAARRGGAPTTQGHGPPRVAGRLCVSRGRRAVARHGRARASRRASPRRARAARPQRRGARRGAAPASGRAPPHPTTPHARWNGDHPRGRRGRRKRSDRPFSRAQAKRRRNGSHYDAARDAIRWRVEWRVDGATLGDESANERTPLRELLAAHAAAAGRRPPVACDLQDPETFALLLLRAPGPANDPRYDRLDPSVGLDLNLADRCVIEYPQIVVARPGDVDRRFRLAPNPVQLFFADDQSTSAGGHGEMRRA